MSKSTKQAPLEYAVSKKDWNPHDYQKRAMKWLLEHAGAGLFLDPGLGKTSVTMGALKVLKRKHKLGRALVVAPLRVCASTWPNEAAKWNDFAALRLHVLHSDFCDKDRAIEGDGDIFCINPEGLSWLLGAEYRRTVVKRRNKATGMVEEVEKVTLHIPPKRLRWLYSLGFTTLVVDESTRFKNPSSLRSTLLAKIVPHFLRRIILTGTPAPNGLMDLFGQIKIIDEGRALGRYVTQYRKEFFFQTGFGGYTWLPQETALERINERIGPYILRLSAREYLDLPELVENIIRVDLPPDARRIYDEMEKELVTQVLDRTFSAANTAAAMSKCAQIASGGIYNNAIDNPLLMPKKRNRDDYTTIHSAKDEVVESLYEELMGNPLLIGYEFHHDLDRLKKLFKTLGVKDLPFIGSGTSVKSGKEIEAAWNRGHLPVLAGQPQSMAHGLNLQDAGNHVCFYTLPYDYEMYDQFIMRVLRQGSRHKRIFVHHVIARHTVDEAKLMSLRRKKKGQESLFSALVEYAKARRKGR